MQYTDIQKMRVRAKTNLKTAKELGLLKYHGLPCSKCGSRYRYVSSLNCIACMRDRDDKRTKKKQRERLAQVRQGAYVVADRHIMDGYEILALNFLRYYGTPCPRGHTIRYKSNNQCVACQQEKQNARRARRRVQPLAWAALLY